MDGFKPRDGITIFAGTNRMDILDPALLRAGRFDRHIAVDKPDLEGRKQISKIYLSKVVLDGDTDEMAQKLAEMTPGYTGADINNIVNEAAIIAIRNKHEKVQLTDLISAVDRVLCGMEKKHNLMTPEEKRRIAYHEAGHAMIGWFSDHVRTPRDDCAADGRPRRGETVLRKHDDRRVGRSEQGDEAGDGYGDGVWIR